jgi:hypothetical protein
VIIPVALKYMGLSEAADLILRLGRWPTMIVVLTLALAVIYRYRPSRETPRWRWITWGSALAAILWLGISALFSWYASSFGKFNETYGSLGAVIGFMTWLWISAIVILLVAELDAEMEHQTARDWKSADFEAAQLSPYDERPDLRGLISTGPNFEKSTAGISGIPMPPDTAAVVGRAPVVGTAKTVGPREKQGTHGKKNLCPSGHPRTGAPTEPSPSNRETPIQSEPGDVFSAPLNQAAMRRSSKFVVRPARPSRKEGEHVLHPIDNRQPDIHVGDLTQPIQPAGNAGSGRGDGRSRRNRHA